jgi:hypothetical protein
MERITIEVDNSIARAWREASDVKKRAINDKVSLSIARELFEDSTEEYINYLNTLRSEMAQAGLTQNELEKILKDE